MSTSQEFSYYGDLGLSVIIRGGTVTQGVTSANAAQTTLTLANNTTNYVECSIAGTISTNSTSFTAGKLPLWTIVTVDGRVTTATDKRGAFNIDSPAGSETDPVFVASNVTGTVVTTNAISALSAPEQALIGAGTIVKSTVGGVTTYFRYISGSKTSEASYAPWGGDPTIGNTTGNTTGNTVGNTTGNTVGNTAGGDAAAAALKQLTAYTYKFSRDGGVVGAIPMTLERGTALAATGRITKAWFETSGLASGTSAATVALSAESAGDILVAAVIGTLSAFNDGIPANSAATTIVLSGAVPALTIAVEDLTAGKVRLYVEWLPAITAL